MGSTAQRAAEYLLAHRAVHVIATDAHETRRRKPKMAEARKAIARLTSDEIASQLAVSNPSAIVAGHTLPYAPKPKL
jgi:protein-tyrosine phosphatase